MPDDVNRLRPQMVSVAYRLLGAWWMTRSNNSNQKGISREGRRNRRKRAHRKEAGEESQPAWPQGGRGVPLVGRQRPDRRGAGGGAQRCRRGGGRVELAVLGGRRGPGVLRDVHSEPACRGEGRRGAAPRRPVGGQGGRAASERGDDG